MPLGPGPVEFQSEPPDQQNPLFAVDLVHEPQAQAISPIVMDYQAKLFT